MALTVSLGSDLAFLIGAELKVGIFAFHRKSSSLALGACGLLSYDIVAILLIIFPTFRLESCFFICNIRREGS